VYIDPRNLQEFYYGKGKGERMNAHLNDEKDSEKTRIIRAIKKEGLMPMIKVVARGLTENEAFLVEKTLIWKLGRSLTNESSGHFKEKFRPQNTLHLDMSKFDYENGIYYVNVGDGSTRSWEDCRKFGFLAAGQGKQWSDPLRTLNVGDIVVAYLKGSGYVGIGRVIEYAKKAIDFKVNGRFLRDLGVKNPGIFRNSDNEKSDYLVKTKWIRSVAKSDGKWKKNQGLFTKPKIKFSLERQTKTIEFLEKEFDTSFKELMKSNERVA
jgi:hypothetical protein